MSAPFQLLPLGVGDAFSETRYHTCFVFLAGDARLMIDCPEPLFKMLRESSEQAGRRMRIEEIDDIVLTHLHADHVGGFENYCYYKKYFEEKLGTVHLPPEIAGLLWDQRLRGAMGRTVNLETGIWRENRPEDYYRTRVLAYGRENPIGPFHVSIRPALHTIPTVGVIVRHGDLRVGYSCDTSFDPDHIAWLSGCDMILHETGEGLHTSLDRLVALPEEIRTKIWLVHLADDFDVENAPLRCLRQGCLYTVTKAPAGAVLVE